MSVCLLLRPRPRLAAEARSSVSPSHPLFPPRLLARRSRPGVRGGVPCQNSSRKQYNSIYLLRRTPESEWTPPTASLFSRKRKVKSGQNFSRLEGRLSTLPPLSLELSSSAPRPLPGRAQSRRHACAPSPGCTESTCSGTSFPRRVLRRGGRCLPGFPRRLCHRRVQAGTRALPRTGEPKVPL